MHYIINSVFDGRDENAQLVYSTIKHQDDLYDFMETQCRSFY